MENGVVANFHYEYQLADQGLPDKKVEQINREFEYIALLWGNIQKLYTYQNYDSQYLETLSFINPKLPEIVDYKKQSADLFWGQLGPEFKILNSKQTSFLIGKELKINPEAEYFNDREKLKAALSKKKGPFIIRSTFSVAGKGVLVTDADSPSLPRDLDKLMKETFGQGYILEPFYQRVVDFSAVVDEEDFYLYETLVDDQGVFRGVSFDCEKILKYQDYEALKMIYQKIFNAYKKLGATQIQVDSFIYYSNDKILLYPLVEANVRKTMGLFAKRLRDRLALDGESVTLYLAKARSPFQPRTSKSFQLSSRNSRHKSLLCFYTNQRDQQDDISHFLNGPQ